MIITTILQIALSVSVIVNSISIFGLLKALKKNDHLALKVEILENKVGMLEYLKPETEIETVQEVIHKFRQFQDR